MHPHISIIYCAFNTSVQHFFVSAQEGTSKFTTFLNFLKPYSSSNVFFLLPDNQGHVGAVNAAAFSQDGHFFASGEAQQLKSL
jgi:hypothetical protein